MMRRFRLLETVLTALVALAPATAFAHVVVKPAEVGIAAFQTFTVSVPVEGDVPTVKLRLVVPEGLKEVTPTVKPGWTISIKKDGEGDDARVTEIEWVGGIIPAGQRDDFSFSAQAPAKTGEVQWKAYQTYQDGSVVSWDQAPGDDHHDDEAEVTPYSTTKVVDDLAKPESTTPALLLSIAAVILSLLALTRPTKK